MDESENEQEGLEHPGEVEVLADREKLTLPPFPRQETKIVIGRMPTHLKERDDDFVLAPEDRRGTSARAVSYLRPDLGNLTWPAGFSRRAAEIAVYYGDNPGEEDKMRVAKPEISKNRVFVTYKTAEGKAVEVDLDEKEGKKIDLDLEAITGVEIRTSTDTIRLARNETEGMVQFEAQYNP